jgi:hypothetical protein
VGGSPEWQEHGAHGSASPSKVLPNGGCLNGHHSVTNLHLLAAAVMPVENQVEVALFTVLLGPSSPTGMHNRSACDNDVVPQDEGI